MSTVPYSENPDHVPDPTSISGTLETTNTGGGRHESLTGVTRIFHHSTAVLHELVEEVGNALHVRHQDAPVPVDEAPNETEVAQAKAQVAPIEPDPEQPAQAPAQPVKAAEKTPSA